MKDDCEFWQLEEWSPLPAELSMEDSLQLAELTALGLWTGWPSPSAVEDPLLPFNTPQLCDWPIWQDGFVLRDLVCGISSHSGLLQGYDVSDCRNIIENDLLAETKSKLPQWQN